jgi:hypothetical protein
MAEKVGEVEVDLAGWLLVEVVVVDGAGAQDPAAQGTVVRGGIGHEQANFSHIRARVVQSEDENSSDVPSVCVM